MNHFGCFNDSSTSSPHKSNSHTNSFALNNSLTRRDSLTKGKEMWQLKNTRKELDIKLKKLQNRINFLNSEQEKTEKTIEVTKKKHESYSKLRDEVTKEKLRNNESKALYEKKLFAQQQENLQKTKELQEKIKEKRVNIVKENRVLRNKLKEKIKVSYLNKVLEINEELKKKKKLTGNLHETIKKIHHKKNLSFQNLILQKDEEYLKKIQNELTLQEEAKKKIMELEKVEQECMEKLQSSQKLQQTVNSILASPANKTLNFSIFNL